MARKLTTLFTRTRQYTLAYVTRLQCTPSHTVPLSSLLTLFSDLHQGFPISEPPPKILYAFLIFLSRTLCPIRSHSLPFDHAGNIFWRAKSTKFLLVIFFPSSCSFVFPRPRILLSILLSRAPAWVTVQLCTSFLNVPDAYGHMILL